MQNIRNFAIIAHIDHGKSTLADRLMEITGTISKRQMQDQLLDSNPIERERGITIKLAPVRMLYKQKTLNSKLEVLNNNQIQNSNSQTDLELRASNLELADSVYTLNLIDTPGHVDFSYEVNRSLAACEGAVLLVDATQGIQAQTLAHFEQAKKVGLKIIPVINKIDVTTADIETSRRQIIEILGFPNDEILLVSGKTGEGVPELLQAIVEKVPPPREAAGVVGLVFNSNYDSHLGVVAWIRVMGGEFKTGDKLAFLATGSTANAVDVGYFSPKRTSSGVLETGQVGFIVTNLKDLKLLQVGDTVTLQGLEKTVVPLPGYQATQPVVFMSFFPTDGDEINTLRDSLDKLKLSDSSLSYTPEFSPALGNGFRVGFLGLLHADIVQERLEREFDLSVIAAAPSVGYQVLLTSGQLISVSKASDLPDPSQIKEIREPQILARIFTPETYLGGVIQLCQEHRGTMLDMVYLGGVVEAVYTLPLSELIRRFYDRLKSLSQGFATLDYELSGFAPAELVKLDILVGGEKVDAMSQIVPKIKSHDIGKSLVEDLKDIIPRQQFEISLQAAIGSHIIARSDVKAFRKDVIAKLSGGDQTRKDKLLKKQKKGKARMKRFGKIDLPQDAFLSILKI